MATFAITIYSFMLKYYIIDYKLYIFQSTNYMSKYFTIMLNTICGSFLSQHTESVIHLVNDMRKWEYWSVFFSKFIATPD